jgi:hypothetical protein
VTHEGPAHLAPQTESVVADRRARRETGRRRVARGARRVGPVCAIPLGKSPSISIAATCPAARTCSRTMTCASLSPTAVALTRCGSPTGPPASNGTRWIGCQTLSWAPAGRGGHLLLPLGVDHADRFISGLVRFQQTACRRFRFLRQHVPGYYTSVYEVHREPLTKHGSGPTSPASGASAGPDWWLPLALRNLKA